jgi:ferredoxin-type protein NapH
MGRFESAFNFREIGTLQYIRHFVQLLVFIFANGKIIGLASTSIIVPYLHTTQAPFSTVHGAYDSLEYTIARSTFPLLVLGIIYLTAITVGRLFCGWACPFGMVQDILSYLPFKKEKLSPAAASQLKDLKWGVLGFSIFSVLLVAWRRHSHSAEDPMGVFSDSPFSVLSPASTLFAYIPWMMLWNTNVLATAGFIGWLKMFILVAVFVPSIYVPRFFCRFLCPMGTLLEPLSKYKALRLHKGKNLSKEEFNLLLSDVCPMGVQLEKDDDSDFIDHPACVHCGKCVTEAPQHVSQKILERDL